ncbi:hypothetical protein H5410_012774 [Solanum commersonii]|uniref:Uncharacterized protein n=1 Tax=Solanum commersonii TaxID=4109 RepID=A0A9J6AT37_SOLCO|nr:hypothetical protein H5410_012774 [Solanum commersonii]
MWLVTLAKASLVAKVGVLHLPGDFVILDYEVDFEVPIILGRLSLQGKVIVDMEKILTVHGERRSSNKIPPSPTSGEWVKYASREMTRCQAPNVMMNFDSDGIEKYNELVADLISMNTVQPKKYELDIKNHAVPTHKTIYRGGTKIGA